MRKKYVHFGFRIYDFSTDIKEAFNKNIYFILRKGKLSCLKFHKASSLDFFEVVSFYCPVSFALLFFCTPTQRIIKFDAIRVRTIFFLCVQLFDQVWAALVSKLFICHLTGSSTCFSCSYLLFYLFVCVCARVFLTRQCGSVTRSNRESKKKGRGVTVDKKSESITDTLDSLPL